MFNGDFRESKAEHQEIKDVPLGIFEEFMSFLYSGSLRNEDVPVDELIIVADRYQVPDLLQVCEAKLMRNINSDNAESIFRIASSIQCNSELKKVSFHVLQS